MDAALYERHASKSELRRVLAGCERWSGTSRARQVIDFADGLAESVLVVREGWRAGVHVLERDVVPQCPQDGIDVALHAGAEQLFQPRVPAQLGDVLFE